MKQWTIRDEYACLCIGKYRTRPISVLKRRWLRENLHRVLDIKYSDRIPAETAKQAFAWLVFAIETTWDTMQKYEDGHSRVKKQYLDAATSEDMPTINRIAPERINEWQSYEDQ